jgi:alpha-beta hydrolase superfamily lysophospholipase
LSSLEHLQRRQQTIVVNTVKKMALSALVVDVAPAGIAGVQKPGMAKAFHILVSWIPAIPAEMTASIFFQLLTRT